MRYMLVNVSQGNLQVDLHSPDSNHNLQTLHRPGKVICLNVKRGDSVDLLPYFEGSVEAAHASVKYSRDVLQLLRPNIMHTYVCDDDGVPVEIDKLFGKETVDEKPLEDVTKPDMGQGAVLAAVDQHEAEMTGEANTPEPMEAEDSKSKKKKVSKKKTKGK